MSTLERVDLTIYVNREQLNDHLGNTPNVTAARALEELISGALSEYLDSYNDILPTGIDFSIEVTSNGTR